ncbi:MAG TPA: hypothetical protein DD666_17140 [Advenella kashmirensis]|uniref:Uncharacterized protein n=1 Tax=Advenella kashmirensis TaxID=310575 RepID=A0A356LKM2_9BURK|nr:hypothetical protein [Advenella kashmirensis]
MSAKLAAVFVKSNTKLAKNIFHDQVLTIWSYYCSAIDLLDIMDQAKRDHDDNTFPKKPAS